MFVSSTLFLPSSSLSLQFQPFSTFAEHAASLDCGNKWPMAGVLLCQPWQERGFFRSPSSRVAESGSSLVISNIRGPALACFLFYGLAFPHWRLFEHVSTGVTSLTGSSIANVMLAHCMHCRTCNWWTCAHKRCVGCVKIQSLSFSHAARPSHTVSLLCP